MCDTVSTYGQATEYILGRINYERMTPGAYSARDLKPLRMQKILASLGNPQNDIPAVHIAGTKGKGSTAVMMAEVLKAAGYRTGLITSPHIHQFEERMRVDGCMPAPEHVVELVNRCARSFDRDLPFDPTYFELVTALAWLYFRDSMADVAVVETGLGGRLDATSICRPVVTAITNISLDHTRVLGNTIEKISREKAGIIKSGVPLVTGVTQEEAIREVEDVCRQRNAPVYRIGRDYEYDYRRLESGNVADPLPAAAVRVRTPWREWSGIRPGLPGRHQAENAATALTALGLLQNSGWTIPDDAVLRGLPAARCPARIEIVATNPTVIIDSAHNDASVDALVHTLNESSAHNPRTLVFASSRDKDIRTLLTKLGTEFDQLLLTRYISNPRAADPAAALQLLDEPLRNRARVIDLPETAWTIARESTGPRGLICVTGSFFIAAEIRQLVLERAGEPVVG